MDIIVQPFKKWGDLFIIQDYEATIGHECPNYTLSGVSPTNDDLVGVVLEAVENFVSCNSDAIMVELSFLNDFISSFILILSFSKCFNLYLNSY